MTATTYKLPAPCPAPRAAWRTIHGHRYMYLRLGPRSPQVSIPLPGCASDSDADARASRIARGIASALEAGRPGEAKPFGVAMGRCGSEAALLAVEAGLARVLEEARLDAALGLSVHAFAESWLSGELHRRWPDYVKAIDHADNRSRFERYILPVIGDRPMLRFALEDGELVMAKLPPALARGTRRHVAQCLHRLARLAVFPAKILRANPLPPGFLPKLGPGKGSPFLYPEEDAQLLGCTAVPLDYRMAYGILAREGLRSSELVGRRGKLGGEPRAPLPWAAIDLHRGTLSLERTKTGDVRIWALTAGTHRALVRWRQLRPQMATVLPSLKDLARSLRKHLQVAGVERAELGTRSSTRSWLKAHHLRATFVTLALANGKTEAWVQDRTGHRSSAMVNRYRRAARMAAELALGELRPLDEAIPELGFTQSNEGERP